MGPVRAELDDLLESLREENEALLLQVAELEATRDEYRRQMAGLLGSWSWRVTAPLRRAAASARFVRRRIRETSERVSGRSSVAWSHSTGLFPPPLPTSGSIVTAASPLLAYPRPSAGNRQPRLDGAPSDARVLVVAHVYYPDVWPDIEDRLDRIPEPYDLVVSLVDGRADSLAPGIRERIPGAMIHHVENRGRDLGSLVELANAGLFDGYDAILKVHTKRSPHHSDGDGWRGALLDGLLPSPEGIGCILELLRLDRSVGLVVPSGSLRGSEAWGANRRLVEALAARIPFAFNPDALRYPAGSMYWTRPWALRRLADLRLGPEHFEPEAGHVDASTAHALERFVGVAAQASGLDVVDSRDVTSRLHRSDRDGGRRPKVLAFYLPPPDWARVDSAGPLYNGHAQPAEPGELGRYSLSDPVVFRRQAALAAEHGVDGFVMQLDPSLRNLLDDPSIDFRFALCSEDENVALDDILPALRDPRYVTVDGRPLLILDRIGHVETARATIGRWKERARADGLGGFHVLAILRSRDLPPGLEDVVDGLVQFPTRTGLQSVKHLAAGRAANHSGDIYSYDAAVDSFDLALGPLPVYATVMSGWDDTPRRGHAADVFHGANPLSFRRWLARASTGDGPLLFVKAWNDWAEGAHLEPDARFGRAWLEAVRDALGADERIQVPAVPRPKEVVAG